MPRLFTAVALPAELRARLAALGPAPPGKWVPGANLHVTLRFLGSVTPVRAAEVTAALAQVTAPRFTLSVAATGAFPTRASLLTPRILWAGVTPHEPLAALKAAIDEVLGPDPEDRRYHPHVTLARLPEGGADLEAFLVAHAGLTSAPFAVTSFALYQSRTLAEGPEYTPIATYSLT